MRNPEQIISSIIIRHQIMQLMMFYLIIIEHIRRSVKTTPFQPDAQANAIGGTVTGNSYSAISSVKNNLLAVKNGALSILSPQLSEIGVISDMYMPYGVRGVESIPIDMDNDGNIGSYEDNDGDPMTSAQETFDLALVLTPDGIEIINVTNPQSPEKMDMIPVSAGKILVDRDKRLAYSLSEGGLSVISLKDLRPLSNPADYGSTRDADGNGIDDRVLHTLSEASGMDMVLNDYGDIAYIADYVGGVVKIVRVGLSEIYIETHDFEFPNVRLRWNDYYPALESKTITIRTNNDSLKGEIVTCKVLEPADNKPECSPVDAVITQDLKMKFQLSGTDLAPSTSDTAGADEIKLRFYIGPEDEPLHETRATYNVKNNSNTIVEEVLAGKAVFVHDFDSTWDAATAGKHKGKTEEGIMDDKDKKFDFVQELLNQVIPRKRSVTDYELIAEDGYYGNKTESALAAFKEEFNININTDTGDMNNTFKKLIKDYELNGQESNWFNRIIDKEMLIGKEWRNTDNQINDDNTINDTGLYELYENVVEKFVDAMIEEGERYVNATGFNNTDGNWKPRTYNEQNPESGDPAQTVGVSYCFGCKDKYEDFGTSVTSCAPPEEGQVNSNYQGNVNDNDCGLTGNKDYPGLYGSSSEYFAWLNNQSTFPQYNPINWAGIDCSGLVNRTLQSARISLNENGNNVVNLNVPVQIHPSNATVTANYTEEAAMNWVHNRTFFDNDGISHSQRFVDVQTNIRKGDILGYGRFHVSIVYSDSPTCTEDENNETTCNYEIIHAYGVNRYQPLDENGDPVGQSIFSRKVIKTKQNISSQPTGFGRLKLWE